MDRRSTVDAVLMVGVYKSIRSTDGREASISDVLDAASADAAIDLWERITAEPDDAKRKVLKSRWPLIATPHGCFEGRLDAKPTSWSGLTYHDLDCVWNGIESQHNRADTLAALLAVPCVAAVGHSLSGRGISVLCRHAHITARDEFDTAWIVAQETLSDALPGLRVHWDPSTANPARGWFVPPLMQRCTHDPLPPQPPRARPQYPAAHVMSVVAGGPTPEHWAQSFALPKLRSGQWEGPCPSCGDGEDRFFVHEANGRAVVWCRRCTLPKREYLKLLDKVIEDHGLDMSGNDDYAETPEAAERRVALVAALGV